MTGLSTRVAVVAAAPAAALALSLVVAVPAASAAVGCAAALSTAVSTSLAADGYTITNDLTYRDVITDEWTERTTTAAWDNVQHRMAAVPNPDQYPDVIDLHIYADATGVWQPMTARERTQWAAALALLGRPGATFVHVTDITISDMGYWQIDNNLDLPADVVVTGTSTDPGGTTTIACSGSYGDVTTTVDPSGRITGIVTDVAAIPGTRVATAVDYAVPVVTLPSSAQTVGFAELDQALDAVALPGRIRALARGIAAKAERIARVRHHWRPTHADIHRAARVKTAAFNKAASQVRLTRAHLVLKPRGARVYGIAPITGTRTGFTIHRVGRTVRI
jgi:hypothetical protein